jgi:MFS family permease
MLVGGFNYRSLTTVLPSYLSGTADLATQSAGGSAVTSIQSGIVFLVFALGGFGQILGGYLADKFRPALLYVIAILITAPLALCLAHLQLGAGVWIAGVMAVFLFAEQPLENSMVAEATPVKYRSTMYGLKFVFAFGIASLGAYVAGLVWRVEGVQRVFEMYAGMSMLMGALACVYFFLARRASVI